MFSHQLPEAGWAVDLLQYPLRDTLSVESVARTPLSGDLTLGHIAVADVKGLIKIQHDHNLLGGHGWGWYNDSGGCVRWWYNGIWNNKKLHLRRDWNSSLLLIQQTLRGDLSDERHRTLQEVS